jgi:hypothetical protein
MRWRSNKVLNLMGQLKPGVTAAMAEDELTGILRRAPGEPPDVRVQLVSLKGSPGGFANALQLLRLRGKRNNVR